MPRSRSERAAAWLYTGPLGHLWGVLGDLVEFGAREVLARLADRRRGR